MKKLIASLLLVTFIASALSACNLLPGLPKAPRPTEPAPAAVSDAPAEPVPTEALTEAPTEPVVGALSDYVKTGKEQVQDFGDGATRTLRLPEILLDGSDAAAVNSEITDKFGDVVSGDTNYTGAYALDYEAYLNGKVLSVVITANYDGGNSYGLCYSFDVLSGTRLDSKDVCDTKELSYSDCLDALYDNLVVYYEDKWGSLPGNDTEREKTYAYSNLKAAVFYLDSSGKLMALTDIYAAVGGGHWVAEIAAE